MIEQLQCLNFIVSIALGIILWPEQAEAGNLRLQKTCMLLLFPDQMQWSVVSEWDYVCTCADNYKTPSYTTDSSCSMLRVALHGSHDRHYESGALHAEVQIVFVLQSRRALEPVWDILDEKNGTFATVDICI